MKHLSRIQLILKTAVFATLISSVSITAGMVRGIIQDENNSPIIGAAIYLIDMYTDQNINFTNTDSTGKFDISLPESFHEVVLKVTGTNYPDQYWHPDGMVISKPDFPVKIDSMSTFTVRIVLESTPASALATPSQLYGSIEGQVKEGGTPIAGLTLQLIDAQTSSVIESTTTGQYGGYLFFNVPAHKQHHIKAIPSKGVLEGYPIQYYAGMNSTLLPQVELSVPEFFTYFMGEFYVEQFPPDSNGINDTTIINDSADAFVKIKLVDSTGSVILNNANVYVNFWHYHRPADTDSVIAYGVPSGDMFIELDVDGYPRQFYSPTGNTEGSSHNFYLAPGDTFDVEIKMTMNPIFDNETQSTVVKGVIKDNMGKPIPNATIALLRKDQFHGGYHFSVPNIWWDQAMDSDSSGNFMIGNLWDGEYVAFAMVKDQNYIPVFYPSSPDPFSAEIITAKENSTDTVFIEFTLKPGSTLTGYVKDSEGGNVTNPTIHIKLESNNYDNPDTMVSFQMGFETSIDQFGKFEFKGIPAGKWHINAWDMNGIWAMHEYYYDEIITDGINPSSQTPDIIMKAGGNIYGSYSTWQTDSMNNHYMNLGRLFPLVDSFNGYPQFTYNDSLDTLIDDSMFIDDSMHFEETLEWEALYSWIHINQDTANQFKTSSIPEGKMRFVFAPEVNFDMWQFTSSGSYIKESSQWTYFDGATDLASSKLFDIKEGTSQKFDFNIKSGGFAIIGNISSEGGETFRTDRNLRQDSDTSGFDGPQYFRVMAFIKENDNYIKVAESFPADSNRFMLNGLKENEEYYLFMEAGNYPHQWYNGLTDSATSNPNNAAPFKFSKATYEPINLYLQKEPEDYEDWNDDWEDRPSEIKNLKMTTVGLKALKLTWSPSPKDEGVVKYRIFRIKANTAQELKNLFVWDTSHGGWEPADEETIMDQVDSIDVVDTAHIYTDISQDSTYMFVIFGINSKGEDGKALSENTDLNSYISSIDISVFKSSMTVSANNWQMIGAPGVDPITFTSSSTDTSSKLFIYYWDESAESTSVFTKYQKTNTVNPGSGYWIYSTEERSKTISETEIDKLCSNICNVNITLKKGWNQISNPYPYPIYPEFTDELTTLHYFNSSTKNYENPKIMKPWRGYWIHSAVDTIYNVKETPAIATPIRRSRLRSIKKWDIMVSLKGEKYSDLNNYIGAVNSRNALQSFEPPSAFGAPQLFILEDDKKLSKSYRNASAIEQKWIIGLTPSEENMTIDFSDISTVPEDVMLIWTDGNMVQNLRDNSSVIVPKHDNSRYGTVVATRDPNKIALYTGSFLMHQNFPNPFRGITNFEYTIPYTFGNNGKIQNSEFVAVTLNIYNMAGRKVATVINNKQKVGTHRSIWDSKNLSTGVYLAKLKAGNFVKTVKLFKIQ